MKNLLNKTRQAVLVTALGLAGLLPTLTRAEPPPDFVSSILRNQQQAAIVPKGQAVAMVCTKCRTVLLSDTNTKKGFLGWFQSKTKHECPGCGGEFSMKDVPAGQGGKVSVSEYIHTCSKCGDDSAFCCTTQPGAGPTKGMNK